MYYKRIKLSNGMELNVNFKQYLQKYKYWTNSPVLPGYHHRCLLTYMRRGGPCSVCPPWGTACCCTPDRILSPQSPGPLTMLTSSHPAAINMPPPHQDQPPVACVCFCPAPGWLLVTWPASVKMAMIRTQTACYRIKKAAAAASFPSQSQTPDATSFKPQFLSAEFIAIYYFSWHEYWLAPPASLTLVLRAAMWPWFHRQLLKVGHQGPIVVKK